MPNPCRETVPSKRSLFRSLIVIYSVLCFDLRLFPSSFILHSSLYSVVFCFLYPDLFHPLFPSIAFYVCYPDFYFAFPPSIPSPILPPLSLISLQMSTSVYAYADSIPPSIALYFFPLFHSLFHSLFPPKLEFLDNLRGLGTG
jgi:hypothetical protein